MTHDLDINGAATASALQQQMHEQQLAALQVWAGLRAVAEMDVQLDAETWSCSDSQRAAAADARAAAGSPAGAVGPDLLLWLGSSVLAGCRLNTPKHTTAADAAAAGLQDF
jgi:hypothetical protein